MPPSQWVKLRQNRFACDSAVTSVRMEAPVVVKPLMDSNSASSKRGISPVIMKGRAPTTLIMIHVSATITKPSRA